MKILLKIILFPITITLNILLGISKIALYIGGGILGTISLVFLLISIGGFCTSDYQLVAIPSLVFAYLLSPVGLPLIAVFIIGNIELFNDWLKAI